jgi:hypothetical protein
MDNRVRHLYHRELFESGRWLQFSCMEQLSNIGTDIDRAISWKKRGKLEDSRLAFERALELLDFTLADPKNKKRLRELCRARELLVDYFAYDNEHNTSDEFWHNYFMFFSYIAAEERAQKYEKMRQAKG